MKKNAVFPGSFSPFTIGHQSVIDRALPLFDKIIIAIGINSEKNQENILKVSQYLFQQLVLGSKVEHKLLVSLLSLRARLG